MQIYTTLASLSPVFLFAQAFEHAVKPPHTIAAVANNRIIFFIVLIEIKFPFELLNIVFKPTYLIFIVGYNAFQF